MKTFKFKGYICHLGQTAKENWLLLDEAEDCDLFFHLTSFPSGYVVLKYEKEYTPEMLITSAGICKEGTKYRKLKDLKVDYCHCDNLKKGEKPGVVYFKSIRKVKQLKL
jgi:predicted ribosome quality control (RQC) complex YloA/Tae2 family protein